MGLALLVWVGGGLLKRVLYFLINELSLGRKSPILHLLQSNLQLFSSGRHLCQNINPLPEVRSGYMS